MKLYPLIPIVKLTPELKKYLGKQCYYYSAKLKIKTPLLVYTPEELYAREGPELKRFKLKQKWGFSIYDDKEGLTYLNIEKHKDIGELTDTLVHELLHMHNDKLRHGSKFDNLIYRTIIGDYP